MRVSREVLLGVLESVSPGLAGKEIIEQSTCLVFTGGKVVTFNDEVAASRPSPIKVEGAVRAKPLLDLLSKMPEDEVDVEQSDKELLVKGKRRKAGLRMEAQVMLPVESVEDPEDWRPIPSDFVEAVSLVANCASSQESEFVFTCLHLHPQWIEACDRMQIARYPLATGFTGSVLARAESMRRILGYDMAEISETSSWLHFRNPSGLVLSIRKYLDEYKSLDQFITPEGTEPVALPGGLEEVVKTAEIFSSENALGNHVRVDLGQDRLVITGEGSFGWYKEMKEISFAGDPISFLIAPRLLLEVSKKSSTCRVSESRLFVEGGKFRYATSTAVPEKKQDE